MRRLYGGGVINTRWRQREGGEWGEQEVPNEWRNLWFKDPSRDVNGLLRTESPRRFI